MGQDLPGGFFPVLQISGLSSALTKGLCWGIHRNKNNFGVPNSLLDLGREEEIHVSGEITKDVSSDQKIVIFVYPDKGGPAIESQFIDIVNGKFDGKVRFNKISPNIKYAYALTIGNERAYNSEFGYGTQVMSLQV